MTARPAGRGGREEAHEGADEEMGFLAQGVPPDARVVGLVLASGSEASAASIVDALAAAVAGTRPHTLLTPCGEGSEALDRLLGADGAEGLQAALEGRLRLAEVAMRCEDRPYLYLPGGRPPPGPELLGSDRFTTFAERIRRRGGTLLVQLPEAAMEAGGVEVLDGYLAVGRLSAADAAGGVARLGRVTFGAPQPVKPAAGARRPGAPEQRDEEVATAWRPRRRRASAPWAWVVAGAAAVAALALAWWFYASSVTRSAEDGAAQASGVEEAAGTGTGGVASGAAAVGATTPPLADPADAPELSYSVLIASYATFADARVRLEELRREGGTLYFAAPTPVQGALYHRVFAGARADTAGARRLMEELVRSGRKEQAGAWHVRPTRWAYRLGVFASRSEAEEEAARAAADSVPAYVLAAAAPGADTAFQVYAGAYESEGAARALAALLERKGLAVELTRRTGEAR